jgi:cytochrome P450
VVALLDHPGQLAALLADPRQLPAAIDELIRFTAPVPPAIFRVTTEPMAAASFEYRPAARPWRKWTSAGGTR